VLHSSCAQLSLRSRDGAVLSLVSGAQGVSDASAALGGAAAPPRGLPGGLKLWGLRIPAAAGGGGGGGGGGEGAEAAGGGGGGGGRAVSAGVVGALPLGDAFVASAWAEARQAGGGGGGGAAGGWGVGLHSQPDAGGAAVGLVLARPAAAAAAAGAGAAPTLCELSWRLPLASGLELSPGALVVRAPGGGAAAALRLGAGWRF
jgi:hypothetical protein